MSMININVVVLALSSFLLSACLTYLLWSKIRVAFLREELFQIRDSLWDAAQQYGGFDDPAYTEARVHLNAAIMAAPLCSVSILGRVAKAVEASGDGISQKSANEQLQAAIDQAYMQATVKSLNYIFVWRASGWLHVWRFRTRAMQRQLMLWLKSSQPAELAECESRVRSRGAAVSIG